MKRFRVKLRDEFDPTLLPQVEGVFQSESLLHAVVHGHLLLERALTTLIGQKMQRPNVIEDGAFGRWSFHQKLGLYVGLYDPPEERQEMLSGFNKLRNALAHRLDDAGTWVSKCLPWPDESPPQDARSHVWTITAILFFELGILQGIENLESASVSEEAPVTQGEPYSRREASLYYAREQLSLDDSVCRLTGRTRSVCPCDLCREARSANSKSRGGVTGDDRSTDADAPESSQQTESDSAPNLELHFMHPRDSASSLTADVNPRCSGREALLSLTIDTGYEAAFLPTLPPGRTYELFIHRTLQRIEPEMTFEEAGAIDGDWIDIQQSVCLGI